jgi:NADH-quinone oxidoreductase subunit J
MNISSILFYAISTFILVAGVLAVTTVKIFRSAIWLLFSLIGIAALYFWMQVEFIAAIQIVVYVGGIVVLIIFSIFLTQNSGKEMNSPKASKKIFAALAALFGTAFVHNLIVHYEGFAFNSAKPFNPNVAEIGTQMLSTTSHGFILPFEAVSMLLLAAMVGCIVIALRPNNNTESKTINNKE